ncbi:acyl-CoA N-acyltransferase [Microthyrium microscopicum]|uniref:Acyl-CoA N-acyltransferase n=1 Tax=Microthyrium microscopicum TaxID=703497 RepID=A0A6A6U7B9_9PEZI|nr:acyl-CoA N-acyltransferase [Microthyrium microscopicum]
MLAEKTAFTSQEKTIQWDTMPYPPAALLTTTRLIIRPYHIKDAPRSASLANDEAISASMTDRFPYPYTLESAQTFINFVSSNAAANAPGPPIHHFCICLADAPEVMIGGIGTDIQADVHRRGAEIGYWIGKEYWGKGYMSEAVDAFIGWLFGLKGGLTGVEGEDLVRLGAGIFGGNEASLGVLRKVGCREEGRVRNAVWKRGELRDLVLMGITRKDWEEKVKKREG